MTAVNHAPALPDATPEFNFNQWSQLHLTKVEAALSQWVAADAFANLADPMRYAVLDGGKRLRPLLVLATAEAVDGNRQAALRAACAVELIHAYSLVHDDMPCMDNDVLRRGKATVHVKFGQASALLAGDALQALAFELLLPADNSVPIAIQANLCRILARAAGYAGMAGGQAIDLANVGLALTEPQLRQMHCMKTGALLEASVVMGTMCGNQSSAVQLALKDYGAAIGLAFQVVDDILDVTADSSVLGKTAGKDAAQAKPTYVSVLGLERSQAYAHQLLEQALNALEASRLSETRALRALAHTVIHRFQ